MALADAFQGHTVGLDAYDDLPECDRGRPLPELRSVGLVERAQLSLSGRQRRQLLLFLQALHELAPQHFRALLIGHPAPVLLGRAEVRCLELLAEFQL